MCNNIKRLVESYNERFSCKPNDTFNIKSREDVLFFHDNFTIILGSLKSGILKVMLCYEHNYQNSYTIDLNKYNVFAHSPSEVLEYLKKQDLIEVIKDKNDEKRTSLMFFKLFNGNDVIKKENQVGRVVLFSKRRLNNFYDGYRIDFKFNVEYITATITDAYVINGDYKNFYLNDGNFNRFKNEIYNYIGLN